MNEVEMGKEKIRLLTVSVREYEARVEGLIEENRVLDKKAKRLERKLGSTKLKGERATAELVALVEQERAQWEELLREEKSKADKKNKEIKKMKTVMIGCEELVKQLQADLSAKRGVEEQNRSLQNKLSAATEKYNHQ